MKDNLLQMRDKLNNISKRNRSIRLLKIYNKWNFDLTNLKFQEKELSLNPVEPIINKIITGKPSSMLLLQAQMADEESLVLSKKLTDLFRNLKSIEEETGIYDFFLGYPFLSGKMLDGTFFQAPLFLYSIRLERHPTNQLKWMIRVMEEPPQVNRALFLAFKKINGISFEEEWFEELLTYSNNIDSEKIMDKLKELDSNIQMVTQHITPLKQYKQDTIPDVKHMSVLKHAIIGSFPQGDSSIIKDYEQLIQMQDSQGVGIIDSLLNGITSDILNEEDWDEHEVKDLDFDIKEEEQVYLMHTDGSQEYILKEARRQKGLVIHGPPGTGKSQVIVNLITDTLAKGGKILVVCQKRAALDVIEQRMEGLGLSSFLALIHDEKNDRKHLYKKIGTQIQISHKHNSQPDQELMQISKEIHQYQQQLNQIAKVLYEYQVFGYRLYDLYARTFSISQKNIYLDVKDTLKLFNKENLKKTLTHIRVYAEWHHQYGKEDYLLSGRSSYADFDLHNKIECIDLLKSVLKDSQQIQDIIVHKLNDATITPAYALSAYSKINKINDLLDIQDLGVFNKFKLWKWKLLSGKTLIQQYQSSTLKHPEVSSDWSSLQQYLHTLFTLANLTTRIKNNLKSLSPYIGADHVEQIQRTLMSNEISFTLLEKILLYIEKDFDELKQMDHYYQESELLSKQMIDQLRKFSINEVLDCYQSSDLPDSWANIVRNTVFTAWINEIEKNNPEVQKISSKEFEIIREKFSKSIDDKRIVGRTYIEKKLLNCISSAQMQYPKLIKDLSHQVNKSRSLWPLRRLVDVFAGSILLDIVPVWLASPETVSSIFPLKESIFDLVIFDEASQCTVESALPAAYRGKKIVIAGDEKQLAPNSAFRSLVSAEEDEDEEFETEESPSILNLAKRRFPTTMLQWHYRSKYEELINFSNHAFYNGMIQIAPSVQPLQDPPSMIWDKVDGSWINTSNEVEANRVVNILKKLLIEQAEQSIGIITFNATQQSKILDVIDRRLQEDEEFSVLYQSVMSKELDERIFVKNIENVQGDERDVIIFSVGFAKNENGQIFNRFGWLNQANGENRLNVAITRAKNQIIVVSSIEPEQLNVTNTKNIGPKLLKSYLKYVQSVSTMKREQVNHVLKEIGTIQDTRIQNVNLHFDSPFEEQVYNRLTDLGYTIDTQIGMSGYKIDLAVVHPDEPQRYIIGIECDGAMYHSSTSAKERDVYRQRFLESRNWTIERIWSRNWWRNPDAEIERIQQRIELIRKENLMSTLSM